MTPAPPAKRVQLRHVQPKSRYDSELGDGYHLCVTPQGVYMFKDDEFLWSREDMRPTGPVTIVREGGRVKLSTNQREILDVPVATGINRKRGEL